MKPRLVPQVWISRIDLQKEADHWQELLNTDVRASSMQRAIYRLMRDWKQKQADRRTMYRYNRKQWTELYGEERNQELREHREFNSDETHS